MTEEDRGYQMPWSGKPGDMYRRDSVTTMQSEAVKQMWNRRWLCRAEPSAAKMAQWPTLGKRLALGSHPPVRSGANDVDHAVGHVFLLSAVFPDPGVAHAPAVNFNNLSGFNFAFFFPAMIVIGQWYQQHPVWGMELLRPATRNRYLQVSGLTLAMWTALAWAMQVSVGSMIAAVVPTGVNWPKLWISIAVSAAITMPTVRRWAFGSCAIGRSHCGWQALVATIIFTSVIATYATSVNTPNHGVMDCLRCRNREPGDYVRCLPPLAEYRVGLRSSVKPQYLHSITAAFRE